MVCAPGCFTDVIGNPSGDTDSEASSSGVMDEGSSTSIDETRGPTSASGPASDSDPSGSTSGTADGSTSGLDTGGLDTDGLDTTTGFPPPPEGWPARCVFDADALPSCGTDPLAITDEGGDGCLLTGLANDGAEFCGMPEFAETDLQSPAGQHVIGVLGVFGAVSLVGQDPQQAPLDCAQAWGPFTTTPQDAAGLAVRVRSNSVTAAPIVARPIDSLCDIAPGGDNCCDPSGATPASSACGDEGLRECVVGFDPYCDNAAWDQLCVATAVLRCGANCLDLGR